MFSIKNISPYGICGALGFVFGMAYLYLICKKRGRERFGDYIYIYVWAAIAAIVGAKILYLILELPVIFSKVQNSEITAEYLMSLVNGGFVFYGGLFAALFAVRISCNYFKMNPSDAYFLLVPAMPLAHCFGRIGCAIVGCCYGIKVHRGLSIVYHHSSFAPSGVKLFPVQLFEAAGNLIIFVVLLALVLKDHHKIGIPELYLLMYAVERFFLEFLRGDPIRGKLYIFSTSQWISLGIIVSIVAGLLYRKARRKNERAL